MTVLQIDIAEKSYANDVCTLRDLQFEVTDGEFVALVGPSGTGKTTLLNIVAGLEQATSGGVQFSTPEIPDVGFMFQEPRLMPWLTVEENMWLVQPEPLESGETQAYSKEIDQLLHYVGLQEFKAAYPRQLSGGMQRRAALVRAFIRQPKLLLMDEPFQSLDEPTADQLRALLLDLWRDTGATVLFVTHHLSEALTLADRVLFLSARPAHVVLDYSIGEGRPRELASVGRIQLELLSSHPQLLAGIPGA